MLEMNVNEIFSNFQCWYDDCSLVAESDVNLSIVLSVESFQKKISY